MSSLVHTSFGFHIYRGKSPFFWLIVSLETSGCIQNFYLRVVSHSPKSLVVCCFTSEISFSYNTTFILFFCFYRIIKVFTFVTYRKKLFFLRHVTSSRVFLYLFQFRTRSIFLRVRSF
jgi:hypothetical protein